MENAINTPKKWFKSIPWYGVVIGLLATLGFQGLMYAIGYSFVPHTQGYWYGIDPQIPTIDGKIPVVPYFFADIYILWYVVFPVGAVLASARITSGTNKRDWINLMISWVAAIFVGGLILALFPTFVDRHNTAGVPNGDIYLYVADKNGWDWWLEKIILNNVDREFCCLPSFHVLNITFCYFAFMGKKDRHIVFRIFWLLFAILTCFATLFVKQHYFIDIFVALVLSLISFFLVRALNPGRKILESCPNFLIIKKINWSHEKITVKTKKTKKA